MGGGASHEEASMVNVDEDGNLSIKESFLSFLMDAMDLDVKRPVVTKEHEALIKANWAAVNKGTVAYDAAKHLSPTKFFYTTFYSLMFKEAPSIRPMFRSSMTVQGKVLAGIIGTMSTVIKSKNVVQVCQDLAARHTTFGATKEHYNVMGLVLMKTLAIISGPEWNDAVHEAYLTAYCFLYYLMLPVIMDKQPKPIKPSLPGKITAKETIGDNTVRLSITMDFPLRYHAGDSILLGLPLHTGEVRRSYAISSVYDAEVKPFDICVEAVSESSKWLVEANVDSVVNVYWINGGVHFETDTPDSIPKKLLFVSQGIGAAPFHAMTKGCHSIKDKWDGDIAALHVTSNPISAFQTIHWDRCTMATANELSTEALLGVAPDLAHRRLYIAGSTAFAEEPKNSFSRPVVAPPRLKSTRSRTHRSFKSPSTAP
ncbi:hypothetical protein SPRG_12379 [Saprolegnia parasitica CBS 223.65]|uniref:nitric oxide dioxygenase n=1 Tax=Saprolegnia parasitica (strain CBS 223.65) TaxID=695850 RepID=A0A067C4Y5_SAPPC|nr:hypothetical protein SPRG_12379 [Saprolegnia parasitica CBS 223.65]KDO21877.1 hypothetical protein SPRG_12379 [Saprolegnia parasitica CBS 223.65]|eukprot:XP_012207432.1 hypothetical protein SPRG_12379 [Saprolegnia parasitica CBS 223.65]